MIKPMRYKRRPLEVDVYRVFDVLFSSEGMPPVIQEAFDNGDIVRSGNALFVETGDGETVKTEEGDYLVRLVKNSGGMFAVYGEERFHALHVPVYFEENEEETDGRDIED